MRLERSIYLPDWICHVPLTGVINDTFEREAALWVGPFTSSVFTTDVLARPTKAHPGLGIKATKSKSVDPWRY